MIKTRSLIVFNTGEEVETSKTVEQVIVNGLVYNEETAKRIADIAEEMAKEKQ